MGMMTGIGGEFGADSMESEALGLGVAPEGSEFVLRGDHDPHVGAQGDTFSRVEDPANGIKGTPTQQAPQQQQQSQPDPRDAHYQQWENRLAQQQAQVYSLIERLSAFQQPAAQTAQAQPEPPAFNTIEASLDPAVFNALDPQSQMTIRGFDQVNRQNLEMVRGQMPQTKTLEDAIAKLNERIDQQETAARVGRWQREATAAIKAFGKENIAPIANQIMGVLHANPGMTVNQAIFQINPEVVLKAAYQRGAQEAQRSMSNARMTDTVFGGVNAPSAMPKTREYRVGESMEESVLKTLGGGLNGAATSGAGLY